MVLHAPVHPSIANGMMGMMFFLYAIPVVSLALVVGVVVSRRLSDGPRRAVIAASILLACGVWTLVRTGGITGDADSDFAWRWSQTPEERLLAQAGDEPAALDDPTAWPDLLEVQAYREHVRHELAGVRTGRASVTILDPIMVEAYGGTTVTTPPGVYTTRERFKRRNDPLSGSDTFHVTLTPGAGSP